VRDMSQLWGLGCRSVGNSLPMDVIIIIRIGSKPPVQCRRAERNSHLMEVRRGYSNCPFSYSSFAISTDLNCGETLKPSRAASGV
jgi:hypothetical protein